MNVHPTKHEIRFHQARLVHDFIVSSLSQVLEPKVNIATTSVQVEKLPFNENGEFVQISTLGNLTPFKCKAETVYYLIYFCV